jgi:hypothetical protein
MHNQGRREEGQGDCPTLIGLQLESESLKLSRFFKIGQSIFEIEGPLQ